MPRSRVGMNVVSSYNSPSNHAASTYSPPPVHGPVQSCRMSHQPMYDPSVTTRKSWIHTGSISNTHDGGSYHFRSAGRSAGPETETVSEWTKPGEVLRCKT